MAEPRRLVLDTNVLISRLQFPRSALGLAAQAAADRGR
jgi:hypothetical protein